MQTVIETKQGYIKRPGATWDEVRHELKPSSWALYRIKRRTREGSYTQTVTVSLVTRVPSGMRILSITER